MPVKIRLMRIGAKKRPFYRVVAVDERRKRTGQYLELLGTYNPLTDPKEVILKQDRIDAWVKNGAQLSDGFLRITGKAPQRPPRKPKKEKVKTPTDKPTQQSENPVDQKISESEIPDRSEETGVDNSDTPVIEEQSEATPKEG